MVEIMKGSKQLSLLVFKRGWGKVCGRVVGSESGVAGGQGSGQEGQMPSYGSKTFSTWWLWWSVGLQVSSRGTKPSSFSKTILVTI